MGTNISTRPLLAGEWYNIKYPRVDLKQQCGICSELFSAGQMAVALCGSIDGTTFERVTSAFKFPSHSVRNLAPRSYFSPREIWRCTTPYPAGAINMETAILHLDCFKVFLQACEVKRSEALRRLWFWTAWRAPYCKAPCTFLERGVCDPEAVKRAADLLGLPQLGALPTELLEMIRAESPHAPLWKCAWALHMANRVEETAVTPHRWERLPNVLSWERGGRLELAEPQTQPPPVIRITIDCDGVAKIERLARAPEYSPHPTRSLYFIVVDEKDIKYFRVQLQNGLLRLEYPIVVNHLLPLWKTPAPLTERPYDADGEPYPDHLLEHVSPIKFSNLTGITFLFLGDIIAEIVPHYRRDSSALSRAEYHATTSLLRPVWVYVPVAPADRIVAFGCRHMNTRGSYKRFLIRLEKSGDVIVGPCIFPNRTHTDDPQGYLDRCRALSASDSVVYDERKTPCDMAFAHPPCSPTKKLLPFLPESRGVQDYGANNFYSVAPLADVKAAEVFYSPCTHTCEGVLLYYENGGVRNLGQCLVNACSSEWVERPTKIAINRGNHTTTAPSNTYGTDLEFWNSDSPRPDEEGWEEKDMNGFLKFWFGSSVAFMTVSATA